MKRNLYSIVLTCMMMLAGQNRTGKFRVDYFRIERISDDSEDAIPAIAAFTPRTALQGIYNLSGQKVKGDLPKGIYIRNGKKVVIK